MYKCYYYKVPTQAKPVPICDTYISAIQIGKYIKSSYKFLVNLKDCQPCAVQWMFCNPYKDWNYILPDFGDETCRAVYEYTTNKETSLYKEYYRDNKHSTFLAEKEKINDIFLLGIMEKYKIDKMIIEVVYK